MQGVSPGKKIHAQAVREKKNSYQLKIPPPPPPPSPNYGKITSGKTKPSPAWTCTAIDLFGPFKLRDELKKRTAGKTYRVIFNCLGTRAVHVDLAADYSTEKF